MVKRRYVADTAVGDGRKPTVSVPWVGRAWLRYDDEDRVWSLTVEPDGESAVTREFASVEDAVAAALGDDRLVSFFWWSPEDEDFVGMSRAQWSALG